MERNQFRGRVLFVLTFAAVSANAGADVPTSSGLKIISRTIDQDQGSWVINYRLQHTGPTGKIVAPEEVVVKVGAWVSNSRVASHAVPRWSELAISGASGISAMAEVIASSNESQRCREWAVVQIWTDDAEPSPISVVRPNNSSVTNTFKDVKPAIPSIAPNAMVWVRLRLEHRHVLYGDYDPLLGIRAIELRLGTMTLNDPVVPMDREQYLAQPKFTWPEPPEERRDPRYSITGPDSLHLEAHIPGHHYYRFPDRPVRYGTKMRLRFWYLIAAGTEGECRIRINQYKDTPTSWRQLNSGGFEHCLKVVGRWTKVERVFTTEPEATTLALDFRIAGDSDVGEMWIDDVSLTPIVARSENP